LNEPIEMKGGWTVVGIEHITGEVVIVEETGGVHYKGFKSAVWKSEFWKNIKFIFWNVFFFRSFKKKVIKIKKKLILFKKH